MQPSSWAADFCLYRMRCIASGHVDFNVNVAMDGEAEEAAQPTDGETLPPHPPQGKIAAAAAQARAFFTSRFESKVREIWTSWPTLQNSCIAQCRCICAWNVLWCQIFSPYIHAYDKTPNYNSSNKHLGGNVNN